MTAISAAAAAPPAAPVWKVRFDDWYALTLAGTRAGWMRVVREDDGARYRTVTEMALHFARNGADLAADSYVEWVEAHDGRPVRLMLARRNGEKLSESDAGTVSAWEATRNGDPHGVLTFDRAWEFNGDAVTMLGARGEELMRVPDAMPAGPWLTPAAVQARIRQRIKDDARTIEYEMVDAAETLRTVTVRSDFLGRSEFPFQGAMVPVTVWQTQTPVNPGQTISHYSGDGKLVYSSANVGIGVLETRLCTRDEALTGVEAPPSAPAAAAAVRPDRDLAATTRRAVYEVRLREGRLPALPSAGAQTVEASADGTSARVTVDSARTSAATDPEIADVELRDGAPIVGSDDPAILELAAQSLRDATGLSTEEIATASLAVVHRHCSPGAEEARTLSAVLRVHRIPSRLASGLARRAPAGGAGAFEWRIWTQALIDGRWRDLDPADARPFRAGHILTGFAGLGAAGSDADPLGFARLASSLEIKIVSQE